MKNSWQKKAKAESGNGLHERLAHEQKVSRRAYELWESCGRRHGEDQTHWLEAEREMQQKNGLNRNSA